VNEVTSASLIYPLSVFNKNSTLKFIRSCQLPRQGSGVGAWQRSAQSGSSSTGFGSWSEFSRPSAPEWYHESLPVTNVSQDPSPEPQCVSFFHSRPSPYSEFLNKVNSRPKESNSYLDSRPQDLVSGGATRGPRYPPKLSKDQNLEVRVENFPRKKRILAN